MSPLGCTTVSSIRLHPDASGWALRLTKAKQRLCKMLNPSEEPLICEWNASPGLSSSSVALVEGSPWYICWPSKDPASHNAIIPLCTHDTLWKLWSVIKNITLPKFRCPPIRREVALWRRMKHKETSQKLPFSTRESDAIPYEMSSTQEHFAHFALTAFSFLPVVFHRWRLFPFVWLLLVCCFSWTTRTKATSPSSSCSSSSWLELNNSQGHCHELLLYLIYWKWKVTGHNLHLHFRSSLTLSERLRQSEICESPPKHHHDSQKFSLKLKMWHKPVVHLRCQLRATAIYCFIGQTKSMRVRIWACVRQRWWLTAVRDCSRQSLAPVCVVALQHDSN